MINQYNNIDWSDPQQVAVFVSLMSAVSERPELCEATALETFRRLTPFQRATIRAGFGQLIKWLEKADVPEWPDEID